MNLHDVKPNFRTIHPESRSGWRNSLPAYYELWGLVDIRVDLDGTETEYERVEWMDDHTTPTMWSIYLHTNDGGNLLDCQLVEDFPTREAAIAYLERLEPLAIPALDFTREANT